MLDLVTEQVRFVSRFVDESSAGGGRRRELGRCVDELWMSCEEKGGGVVLQGWFAGQRQGAHPGWDFRPGPALHLEALREGSHACAGERSALTQHDEASLPCDVSLH